MTKSINSLRSGSEHFKFLIDITIVINRNFWRWWHFGAWPKKLWTFWVDGQTETNLWVDKNFKSKMLRWHGKHFVPPNCPFSAGKTISGTKRLRKVFRRNWPYSAGIGHHFRKSNAVFFWFQVSAGKQFSGTFSVIKKRNQTPVFCFPQRTSNSGGKSKFRRKTEKTNGPLTTKPEVFCDVRITHQLRLTQLKVTNLLFEIYFIVVRFHECCLSCFQTSFPHAILMLIVSCNWRNSPWFC